MTLGSFDRLLGWELTVFQMDAPIEIVPSPNVWPQCISTWYTQNRWSSSPQHLMLKPVGQTESRNDVGHYLGLENGSIPQFEGDLCSGLRAMLGANA